MKKFFILSLFLSLALFGTVKAYTVVSGDNLTKIARKADLSLSELLQFNSHIKNPNLIFPGQKIITGKEFGIPEVLGAGGTLPIAGVTYTLAGSGITGSATSITLQSLTVPQTGYELVDSDFSDTFYITLEPGKTKRQEIVSCTTVAQNANNTATLSGCSRGLLPFSPYTASSTYQFSHAGGTQVIFSDPPQLFNEFTAKSNAETVTRVWTFEQHPLASSTLASPTSTYQYVTKQYADNLAISGAPTSTESTSGRVKLGTQLQMSSSTFSASDPTVLYTLYSTSSPYTAGKWIPITEADGKLGQTFIDLTDSYAWTGAHTFGVTSTFNGPLKVSSTFQSTQPLTVFNLTSSSTLNRIATDFISPTTTGQSTTTFTGNIELKGAYSFVGADVGSGIKWEYMSTDDCDSPCNIPAGAKAAVVYMTIASGGQTSGATAQVFATGLTDSRITATVLQGASSEACYQTLSWGATQLSATETGTCNALDTDAYWFK